MIVDINKKYTTRDNREVRLYSDDGYASREIHGAFKTPKGWMSYAWPKSGRALNELVPSDRDLVEVRRRISMSRWVNVYEDGFGTVYNTKRDANNASGKGIVACVEVFINCLEGDGLS